MPRRGTLALLVLVALAGVAIALVAGGALSGIGGAGGEGSGAGPATEAPPVPGFVEEASAAGLDHSYEGEFNYFVGGGVAVFDCDDDGRSELFIAGGSRPAALFLNRSAIGGALAFERLPSPETDLEAVVGAYPLDVDGDGATDLAVLRYGENVMLRGLGACRFERANEAWGFDGGDRWTTAFSATWEGGSRWPTVAFGHYLDEASTDNDRLCFDNQLLRPDVTRGGFGEPVALSPGWCALSMLFSDWDRSARRDLRVSNDRHYYSEVGPGQEQLWRIEPGRPPRLYGKDEGWQTVRVWGMGIASQDLTGDGYPEVYLTSQGDNKLQTLADGPAQPRYEDIGLLREATAHRPFVGDTNLPSTAWHAEFDDVNNDGLADLFVAKGNVEAQPDHAARDPSNLLLGQPDGTFVEAAEAAGVLSFSRARGAALADLNLDGLLDLVVVNRRENVKVWRNVGAGSASSPAGLGHWLAVRVRQPDGNRDAIGALVEVRAAEGTLLREVVVGGGHAGGQLGWVHVGLGPADRAEVRVQWPDGEWGPWMEVDADSFAIVERGASAAARWSPNE